MRPAVLVASALALLALAGCRGDRDVADGGTAGEGDGEVSVIDGGPKDTGTTCAPVDPMAKTDLFTTLYGGCEGTPFIPACADFSCVSDGEERQFFDIFWRIMLGRVDGDACYRDNHFFINDVEMRDAGGMRVFNVDFVFINDWVRIREVVQAWNPDPSSDEAFLKRILVLDYHRRIGTPVAFSEVQRAIEDCGGSVDNFYWCGGGLGIGNPDGILKLYGRVSPIDYYTNKCRCITMDLESGTSVCTDCQCGESPHDAGYYYDAGYDGGAWPEPDSGSSPDIFISSCDGGGSCDEPG